MHKHILFVISCLIGFNVAIAAPTPVQIAGEFGTCTPQDSFRIFGFVGTTLQQLAATPLTQQGDKYTFSINVNGMSKGFYFIGMSPAKIVPIILGEESPIYIKGNCSTFNTNLVFEGSKINKSWMDVQQRMNQLNQEATTCLQHYQSFPEDAIDLTIKQRLKTADQQRQTLIDSLKKADPYLAKLAGLSTNLSYYNNKRPNETEQDYYTRTYFEFVDLSDPDLDRIHLLANRASEFAGLVTALPYTSDEKIAICNNLLSKVNKNSNAYALMTNSFANAFMGQNQYRQRNDDAFVYFAKLYLEQYTNLNPQITQQYRQVMNEVEPTLNGKPAMDFKMDTPEAGKQLAVSDFKGKVLIVDFWASWCKPCRKENPNVVRIYNKYKNQGLEILSVSLDQTTGREAWLEAIKKDGMVWSHVSDLGGWASAAAKLYKVTGIPYTVILDKNGIIRDKNLRGDVLERKVAELLKQ